MTFWNPEGVEEVGGGFQPIPAGWYRVEVQDIPFKKTKAGTGIFAAPKLNVIEGQFAKRKLFPKFNIKNPSADAERIGKGQFKRFLTAMGVTEKLDSEQAVQQRVTGKMLYAKVTIGRNSLTGEPDNEVIDYADKPKTDSAPAQAKPLTAADQVPF